MKSTKKYLPPQVSTTFLVDSTRFSSLPST
jgi:hypothetical protein